MTFAIVILAAVLSVIAVLLFYTVVTGISPVPTTPRVRTALLSLLPPTVDGRIYELGAGWGGLAVALARRFSTNQVVAIELSPLPWLFLVVRTALFPVPNLEIRRANFHRVPIEDAGLVACYLFPRGMRALRPKFRKELPAGRPDRQQYV